MFWGWSPSSTARAAPGWARPSGSGWIRSWCSTSSSASSFRLRSSRGSSWPWSAGPSWPWGCRGLLVTPETTCRQPEIDKTWLNFVGTDGWSSHCSSLFQEYSSTEWRNVNCNEKLPKQNTGNNTRLSKILNFLSCQLIFHVFSFQSANFSPFWEQWDSFHTSCVINYLAPLRGTYSSKQY